MARRRQRRAAGTRREKKRLLIVTEGSASEPTYFMDFCADHNLGSVVVDGACPSDPESVVGHGLDRFRGEDFDRLYCVFDRDTHDGFEAAIDRLRRARNGEAEDVYWIYSIPCFECWILFHYENTGRDCTHPTSPCGVVVDAVEAHIPDYSKGHPDIYRETKGRLEMAMGIAKQRWEQDKARGLNNYRARTRIFRMIDDLLDMSNR